MPNSKRVTLPDLFLVPHVIVVSNDRRASLDEDSEVIPAMHSLIQKEFERKANIPFVLFPTDGASVQDTPRLTLVIVDPTSEWTGTGVLRDQIAEWTKQRGKSPRLYPGSLVWCLKKPGRDLHDKVELWLAWRRVAKEITEGTLGGDFDRTDRAEIQSKVTDAEEAAKDEVWGGYRFAVLTDSKEPDGLKTIDLGAGHSSSGESMCGRVLTALKSQALLNESVGAGYIERNWPPALKDSGAWPLASLRQSFLNGSLTRLLDPDAILRSRIVDSVSKGDFGLASGHKPDGTYERVWFNEPMAKEEVAFEQGVFLLLKDNAKSLKIQPEPSTKPQPPDDTTTGPRPEQGPGPKPEQGPEPPSEPGIRMFKITGSVPPEVWNRLGTKVIPKLRTGSELTINVGFTVSVQEPVAEAFHSELKQILSDLGLESIVLIE